MFAWSVSVSCVTGALCSLANFFNYPEYYLEITAWDDCFWLVMTGLALELDVLFIVGLVTAAAVDVVEAITKSIIQQRLSYIVWCVVVELPMICGTGWCMFRARFRIRHFVLMKVSGMIRYLHLKMPSESDLEGRLLARGSPRSNAP